MEKDAHLNIRMKAADKAMLVWAAKNDRRPPSDFARQILLDWIEDHVPKKLKAKAS